MERPPRAITGDQKMRQPDLQPVEQEISRTDRIPEIDGNIPESVKDKVNKGIWDRLNREDHPPERAD